MEENKYYTPQFSELCFGYKCHFTSDISTFSANIEDDIDLNKELSNIDMRNLLEWVFYDADDLELFVRTPYLTKEDIESGGWKFKQSFNSRYNYEKGNFWMVFDEEEFTLEFFPIDPCKLLEDTYISNPELFRFFCRAKSVNELRTIEKLLEIK